MRLDKLRLRNFKGVREFTLIAGCADTFIFGKNASGKTTIADAMSWLLFNKDSLGQATFEIKPRNYSNMEVEVEGSFVNGSPITLKKIYKEKFTKKRGSLESELTGHTTEYFVNDVPVKEGEYKAKVSEISTTEDVFRLLTSPTYFNETMHWQKRRGLLFDICGTLTDADVIAAHPDLSTLPGVLAGKPADDYKKIVMAKRKTIKERIETIPARIDEADRGKPVLDGGNNAQAFVSKLTKSRKDLDTKNQEIAQVQAGGGVAEQRIKLAEQDLVIQGITNKFASERRLATQGLKDDLSDRKDRLAECKRNLQADTSLLGNLEAELKSQFETKASLLAEYKRLNEKTFVSGDCPACGQALPEDKLKAAWSEYNKNLSIDLENNVTKGKACAAKITSLAVEIESTKKLITETQAAISTVEHGIADITTKITNIESDGPAVDKVPEMMLAMARRADIVAQIESLSVGSAATIEKLKSEKTEIEAAIAEHEKQLAKIEQVQAADLRIAELKAEEKQLAGEFSTLEGQLFLIESFIKAKVGMLTDAINSKFKLVKFNLFRDQINGGIEEICEASVDGVPYNSLNHAARVAAGMDIINTVGDYYNFHPCIFVDGRESVTELPEMQAQVISLVVSPEDKTLRVEAH